MTAELGYVGVAAFAPTAVCCVCSILHANNRVQEGFGADPYLAGKLANVSVNGLQQSVITAVKHYIGNEQETNRMPMGNTPSISAVIDDQTLHEVYLVSRLKSFNRQTCIAAAYTLV